MNVINNMKESESERKKAEYGKGKVKLVCWKMKVAVILEKGKEKLPNQGRLQNVQRASQSLIASFTGNNKTIRHPSQGNK